MAYIPETIHRTLRTYTKANKLLPIMYTKVYMYQISRSIAYIHSLGVCHRDIKPQNLLLDTRTHKVLLCDFGRSDRTACCYITRSLHAAMHAQPSSFLTSMLPLHVPHCDG